MHVSQTFLLFLPLVNSLFCPGFVSSMVESCQGKVKQLDAIAAACPEHSVNSHTVLKAVPHGISAQL